MSDENHGVPEKYRPEPREVTEDEFDPADVDLERRIKEEVRPYQAEDVLRHLLDREWTMSDIARRFDTTPTTVSRWVDKHGIETEDGGDNSPLYHEGGYLKWSTDDHDPDIRDVPIHQIAACVENDPAAVFSEGTQVHHKWPVPSLNAPSNLEVLPVGVHLRRHTTGDLAPCPL